MVLPDDAENHDATFYDFGEEENLINTGMKNKYNTAPKKPPSTGLKI